MDFIDISKRRITTRQFSPAPVEQEKLDKMFAMTRMLAGSTRKAVKPAAQPTQRLFPHT